MENEEIVIDWKSKYESLLLKYNKLKSYIFILGSRMRQKKKYYASTSKILRDAEEFILEEEKESE